MRGIVLIIAVMIGLSLIALGAFATMALSDTAARIAAEQADFDDYVFIMPDGDTLNTLDLQINEVGINV